ncbi:hypothetical protein PR048_003220 [Dryococelus australis]|uniref:Uncharacterized protein n=1 Tax=Dryococelus australis TaxID=614101 RepID=A0ABQ9IMG8_9NEOP|nr:hypothetical protein PR048_003220 [Dryococelus australis]
MHSLGKLAVPWWSSHSGQPYTTLTSYIVKPGTRHSNRENESLYSIQVYSGVLTLAAPYNLLQLAFGRQMNRIKFSRYSVDLQLSNCMLPGAGPLGDGALHSSAYWSLSCVFIGCYLTLGGYGTRKVFPCESAIDLEACRAGPINCDTIAKARLFAVCNASAKPQPHCIATREERSPCQCVYHRKTRPRRADWLVTSSRSAIFADVPALATTSSHEEIWAMVVISGAALLMAHLLKSKGKKRKPRRWWRTELYKKQIGSELMVGMRPYSISGQYKNFTRMSPTDFENLLRKIESRI